MKAKKSRFEARILHRDFSCSANLAWSEDGRSHVRKRQSILGLWMVAPSPDCSRTSLQGERRVVWRGRWRGCWRGGENGHAFEPFRNTPLLLDVMCIVEARLQVQHALRHRARVIVKC